jgi:UDP-N-acetylglucosamine 2-epimerase
MLQEALNFDGPEDPVFEDIPVDMPRVLVFLRRREHHANASRPLCLALNRLAAGHKDVLFFCPFSLQSHICDALEALLEPQANLLRCAPLPHAPFVREVKRAQLILTDSHGVALEGLALGRPVVMLGREALTSDLERLAVEHGGSLKVVDMEEEALVGAVQDSLNAEAAGPCDRSAISLTTNTGDRMLESIRKWWEAQT